MFGSVPSLKSTISAVLELPVEFSEYMWSMLSTPLTCCSIGVATARSMVSASAPGYIANTRTSGGAMSGNCPTGRPRMVIAPTMTIRIEMTMATIGRLMKNLDMAQRSSTVVGAGFGTTGVASLTFSSPATTTWSPGCKPSSITQSVPTFSPAFTGRMLALLSAPTTATW